MNQQAGIIQRIVSGGQTGADRAGLDWAILEHIAHGGWCPLGRIAEDGLISSRYELEELPTGGYRARTRQNVFESDGTLIVNGGELGGGTLQTLCFAEQLGKPYLVIQALGAKRYVQAEQVYQWLHQQGIRTLNIAGPRESKRPGIYRATLNLLCGVLGSPITSCDTS